jgi:hypothetical protein
MNQPNSMKTFLCAGLLLAVVTSGNGQGWAVPAKAPDIPVPCTGCPNVAPNSLTAGYKAPLFTFTGRYLDSTNTSEWFKPFRTARANFVLPMPALDRIYFRYGNGSVASYQLSTFFNRLETGEQLGYWAPDGQSYRGGNPEVWLRWDTWFNPELGSGWKTNSVDGSLRLTFFDVDDLGYVYIASTLYGWGIVKDDFSTLGHVMATEVQKYPFTRSDSAPNRIAVVKGDTKYYAILGKLDMWDVTDRKNPIKLTTTNVPVLSHFAKNAAADRIAIIDDIGNLTINTADGFATGTAPLFNDTGGGYLDVTSDGTNFFALKSPVGILVLSPAGNGYTQGPSTAMDPKFTYAWSIKYGDGYLVLTGSDIGSGWDLRVYAVNTNLTATPLVINANPADAVYPSYFRNYYGIPPNNNYVTPAYINMVDGTVVKYGGKTYLVVCAKGIGDVYELPTPGPAAPPTHVLATAIDPTTVRVTWTRNSGAASYRLYRGERIDGVLTYTLIGSPAGTDWMFDDTTVSPGSAYLYKMRSHDGTETADSNVDLAAAVVFTEPTLTSYVTPIRSVHFTELLTAVNGVRALAGLETIAFTAPAPEPGGIVMAQHVVDLRQGLDPARSALGLTALIHIPSVIAPGMIIESRHITEIRDGVK